MTPQQRDDAIQGTGWNFTTGPLGGYIPTAGASPAITFGWPFSMGYPPLEDLGQTNVALLTLIILFVLFSMFKIPFMLLIASAVWLTGCNPGSLPGFKHEAKRHDQLVTRETEAAIERSPVFQEIDRICTKEIPRPNDFTPVKKYRSLREEKFLGYGYHSNSDFGNVKNFYVTNLTKHGWQLVRQKDGGWGPSEIEFRKSGFQVIISNTVGGEEIKYFIHCAKLTEEG